MGYLHTRKTKKNAITQGHVLHRGALLAIEVAVDRILEDTLHLYLPLLIRGHLTRDEDFASLQCDLRRRPDKSHEKHIDQSER